MTFLKKENNNILNNNKKLLKLKLIRHIEMSTGTGLVWSTLILSFTIIICGILWTVAHDGECESVAAVDINRKRMPVSTPALTRNAGSLIPTEVNLPALSEKEIPDSPEVVNLLDGISLGMTMLQVTLLKGAPDELSEPKPDPKGLKQVAYFKNESFGNIFTYAILRGPRNSMVVFDVCTNSPTTDLFGIKMLKDESKVYEILGKPPVVSINRQGTGKLLTYPKYNLAFELIKGKVSELCITSRPEMRYSEEFKK